MAHVIIENTTARLIEGPKGERYAPGMNKIDADIWDSVSDDHNDTGRGHWFIVKHIRNGDLKEHGEAPDMTQVQVPTDRNQLAQEFYELTAAEAVGILETHIDDPATLEFLIANERRESVIIALKLKLEKVRPTQRQA